VPTSSTTSWNSNKKSFALKRNKGEKREKKKERALLSISF
jgi:hypothetical protein